jgi:hypothetical protein
MQTKLHKETVSDALWWTLKQLMEIEVLLPFRLVGGTSLSLQLGHRISVDIDLFTDVEYGSIDFDQIDSKLQDKFSFVEMQYEGNNSFGKSYFIGQNEDDIVKVDLFYTDKFIRPVLVYDSIRMASIEEITALSYKLENHNLKTYQELNPRSISILPIANACQARCWFCFSESSISIEKEKFLTECDRKFLEKIL